MKALIVIFIALVAVFLFTQLTGFYRRTARETSSNYESAPVAPVAAVSEGSSLPGLPPHLEASLQQAQQAGLEEFAKWLRTYGRQVQDPRLAWIELDYVVLLNLKDRKEAVARFEQVRARVGPGSPVAERVRKLEPAYAP
ncbi:MAG: hypothetical protein IT580_02280 [Verrucomicrobiales bacterium]|nr:hypothetical protein [Verrucomicrobiales bacterium]